MYQYAEVIQLLREQGINGVNTHSGTVVDVFDPTPEMLLLSDIAWSLPRLPRYLAHTDKPYSVGQHCVLVAEAVYADTKDPNLALAALLHDAPEAYLGDIIRPFKPLMRDYVVLEEKMDKALCAKFKLNPLWLKQIKPWDTRITADEMRDLMPRAPATKAEPLGIRIRAWRQKKTVARFMQAYLKYNTLRS